MVTGTELLERPPQSQEVVHPALEQEHVLTPQEPELGVQGPASPLPPKKLHAHRVHGPHKGHHTASEKGKGKVKDKAKDKEEKRRFLAHRIRRSPKPTGSETSLPTADEAQAPQEHELPVAEHLELAGASEPAETVESSPSTQAGLTGTDPAPVIAEASEDDTAAAVPQRQPSTGSTSNSNSVLHAQVRSLGRQLEARTEEAAQLRRRLEAREQLDAGSGPLSEQLRQARREAAAWRRRAEAAERRVVVLDRFTARLRGLQDAGAGKGKGKSVDGCPRPGDVGSADASAGVGAGNGSGSGVAHAEGDLEDWELDSPPPPPPPERDSRRRKGRGAGPGDCADNATAELWDATRELLEGQERLDQEGL